MSTNPLIAANTAQTPVNNQVQKTDWQPCQTVQALQEAVMYPRTSPSWFNILYPRDKDPAFNITHTTNTIAVAVPVPVMQHE